MPARRPGAGFAASLGALTLIAPLAVHLFLPVMPAVKSAFGISDALAELTFSITLGAMAIVTLAYGSLSDRYGRRPILLGGLALFLVGSAVAALAGSIEVLIVGRLIQAVGAGCGLTLTRAIARDAYGAEALVKAIAYLTMAYALGPMIAPPLGGLLMDSIGWRSVFWFALIGGVIISALAYFLLFETRDPREADERPRGVAYHYAALLGNARFMAFVLQSGAMSFMFFAIAAASPFLMKDLLGRSATEYGLYFMIFPVGYCTGNLISSRLSGRVQIEKMILLGASLCVVALSMQATLILAGLLSPLVLFVPGSMISFAQGLALPNAQAGAMRVVPTLAGTAAGLGVFFQMALSAASTELYGLLADGTPLPMIEISSVGALAALLAAIASFALRHPVASLAPNTPPPAAESRFAD